MSNRLIFDWYICKALLILIFCIIVLPFFRNLGLQIILLTLFFACVFLSICCIFFCGDLALIETLIKCSIKRFIRCISPIVYFIIIFFISFVDVSLFLIVRIIICSNSISIIGRSRISLQIMFIFLLYEIHMFFFIIVFFIIVDIFFFIIVVREIGRQ